MSFRSEGEGTFGTTLEEFCLGETGAVQMVSRVWVTQRSISSRSSRIVTRKRSE